MTVRLLLGYYGQPANSLITRTSAEEDELVARKMASTNLTGGTIYTAPTPQTQYIPAFTSTDASGKTMLVGGGLTYPVGAHRFSAVPAVTLTDSTTTGIGTTLTQIHFITIPGGVMKANSIMDILAIWTMTGNDSKLLQQRAGPASGTYIDATAFGGQSGLTTHKYAGISSAIWNAGSLASQKSTPLNLNAIYVSSTATPLVAHNIDTSLDWNLYWGVQFGIANGAPTNSATLEAVMIEIRG